MRLVMFRIKLKLEKVQSHTDKLYLCLMSNKLCFLDKKGGTRGQIL